MEVKGTNVEQIMFTSNETMLQKSETLAELQNFALLCYSKGVTSSLVGVALGAGVAISVFVGLGIFFKLEKTHQESNGIILNKKSIFSQKTKMC